MLPVVYMDETGNKESDRYFVIGFLKISNTEQLLNSLSRPKDQIQALSRYNRRNRVDELFTSKDINQLYDFAKSSKNFELKYKYVSNENLHYFKILTKKFIHEVDFRLDALVIDRQDVNYVHTNLSDMYKIITHLYFNYRCREDCIFIPDSFDQSWNWNKILNNKNIKAIIPGSSDSFLALQLVDIMTGLIGHGLRQKGEYSKRDFVREPLLKLFCEEANIKIQKNVTVSKPKYISIWTIDFSKTKRGAQSIDKKPNIGA